MFEGAFDVVVLSFRADAPEQLEAVLERLLDVSQADARRFAKALPCAVREAVPYAKAEALAASLSLAGAEVSMRKSVPRAAEEVKSQVDGHAATLAGKAASSLMQHARMERAAVIVRQEGVENAPRHVPLVAPPSVLEPLHATPANDVVPHVREAEDLDFALRPTEEPASAPRKQRMSLLSVLASKLASRELKIPTLPPPTPIEPEAAPLYTKEQLEIAPIFPASPKISAPRIAAPPLRRESEMRLPAPASRMSVQQSAGQAPTEPRRGFWFFGRAVPAKDAKEGFRPFTFAGGEVEPITSRMVWLLAILWLSVGMLLWYHDIF